MEKMKKEEVTFHHLPAELLLRCMRSMTGVDLCCIAQTCRTMSVLCDERELWRHLVGRRWPCRTNSAPSADWRGIFRAMVQGSATWYILVVECGEIEIPVPYHYFTRRREFVKRLASLVCPDKAVSHAVLRRRGPISMLPIAEYWSELAVKEAGNYSGCNGDDCGDGDGDGDGDGVGDQAEDSEAMGTLRLPSMTSAVLHLTLEDHNSPEIGPICPAVYAKSIILNLWVVAGTDGAIANHMQVYVDGKGTVGAMRRQIQDISAVPADEQNFFVPLGIASAVQVKEARDLARTQMEDLNEGRQEGGRGGPRSFEVIWGSNQGGLLMHKLPDWEEDLNVTAGAGICCGVHLLLVRNIQRVNVVIEAPAEWGQARLNGPASFVVWVNRPGTIDFSVGLVAHPWMTIGELSRAGAGQPEWEGHNLEAVYVSSGQAQTWETCAGLSLAGGNRIFFQVMHQESPVAWKNSEAVVKGLFERYEALRRYPVAYAQLRGSLPSSADPMSERTNRSIVEATEMLILRERCVLSKASPMTLSPFKPGTDDTPRQFEYSPHHPGLMVVGSFQGKVALVQDDEDVKGGCGRTVSGPQTACVLNGEVLALNWLSTHSDRLLVGACDVAGGLGAGSIQMMRVVPAEQGDRGGLALDPTGGDLNRMSWVNSVCSNSTDDLFIAAGLNEVRLFDLETGKLCRTMSSWHQAFINCPKFAHRSPQLIASASLDQTCCLWDARTAMDRPCWKRDLGWGGCMVCFSPSDDTILVSGEEANVCQLTTSDGAFHSVLAIESIGDDEGNYTKSYYTADSRFAITTGRLDDCLHLCSSRTGELVESFQIKDKRPPSSMHLLTRTCRPDPFRAHRYTLLVDGWNELPLDELDVVDSEASTLAYVVDLTVAMRETDSERDPVGIRGICDMQ